jgi:UDP-N-acetylmuramate--alanine ligase
METDVLFITDIYPSRETPIEGITGKLVSEAAHAAGHRNTAYIEDRKKLIESVESCVKDGDMVITFGAGDVNKIGYELLNILRKRG